MTASYSRRIGRAPQLGSLVQEVLTRDVEPRANHLVGRVRQALRQGDTRVGVITTLTHRMMPDTAHASRRLSDARRRAE